jgi:hypothetical protein
MYCTICGKSIDDMATVCPYCNSKQVPVVTIEDPLSYIGSYPRLQTLSQSFGKTIGRGIGIGIGISMEVSKGIVDGILSEINKKN